MAKYRRLINYPGSKWRMAETIIGHMPPHAGYLEPFFGSGAVFFNKPKSIVETINDLDGRLVNMFEVIRNDPERLQYLIKFTPYSREEFELSDIVSPKPLEDARRMMVRLWMGVGGKTYSKPGFRKSVKPNGPYCAYEWTDLENRIGYAAARLKDAQIECKDAIQLIKETDNEETLLYCDPPYVISSMVSEHYKHGFTTQQHEELLQTLLKYKGKVILSGYHSEMYADALKEWYTDTKETKVGITTEKKSDRTEVLWMNFQPDQQMNLL